MSDIPMPRDLSEEAVAEWMDDRDDHGDRSVRLYIPLARAVRALLRTKVREAVLLDRENSYAEENRYWEGPASVKNELTVDAIVARVLWDHPSNASGGHDEGRPARGEAPRG